MIDLTCIWFSPLTNGKYWCCSQSKICRYILFYERDGSTLNRQGIGLFWNWFARPPFPALPPTFSVIVSAVILGVTSKEFSASGRTRMASLLPLTYNSKHVSLYLPIYLNVYLFIHLYIYIYLSPFQVLT